MVVVRKKKAENECQKTMSHHLTHRPQEVKAWRLDQINGTKIKSAGELNRKKGPRK